MATLVCMKCKSGFVDLDSFEFCFEDQIVITLKG